LTYSQLGIAKRHLRTVLPEPFHSTVAVTATPEERIDAANQELRQALIGGLRDRISTMSPAAFEDLVLDVLHAMGYGHGTENSRLRTGGGGDAGIDGVIREDRPRPDLTERSAPATYLPSTSLG
jgi:restriction system protein